MVILAEVPGLSAIMRVKETFRRRILSGEASPGDRLPGIRVAAKELSVHPMTVSVAYRQLAGEGLVESRPGSGTYVAGQAAEGELLLLVGGPENQQGHAAAVMRSLADRVRLAGHEIVTLSVGNDMRAVMEALRSRLDRNVLRGVWLSAYNIENAAKVYEYLAPYGIPVIIESDTGVTGHSVNYDFAQMIRKGTQWLIREGCRRVALVGPTSGRGLSMYTEVFIATCDALEADYELITTPLEGSLSHTGVFEQYGVNAVDQLLDFDTPCDGMMILDDWVARGALTALLRRRVRVPEDLRVCSLTRRDNPFWATFGLPLARVEVSDSSIADEAYALMEKLLGGEDVACPHVRIPGRLISPGMGESNLDTDAVGALGECINV
jgi:DNA-binding LacI/PurR family transcriptional regulator